MGELAERYAEPLPQIEAEVAELRARVAAHLVQMGFAMDREAWKVKDEKEEVTA